MPSIENFIFIIKNENIKQKDFSHSYGNRIQRKIFNGNTLELINSLDRYHLKFIYFPKLCYVILQSSFSRWLKVFFLFQCDEMERNFLIFFFKLKNDNSELQTSVLKSVIFHKRLQLSFKWLVERHSEEIKFQIFIIVPNSAFLLVVPIDQYLLFESAE